MADASSPEDVEQQHEHKLDDKPAAVAEAGDDDTLVPAALSATGDSSKQGGKGGRRKGKRSSQDGEDAPAAKSPLPPGRPRVMHFIGVRLKSAKLHRAVESVQAAIIAKSPGLKSSLEHAMKLHVTLLVLPLGDGKSEDSLALLDKASAVLESCREDVRLAMEELPETAECPPHLPLSGISNFGRRVIFADFPAGHRSLQLLHQLQEIVEAKFSSAGLAVSGGKKFRAHATIFKSSNYRSVRLSEQQWSDWASTEFGEARLEEIQLLKMGAPKGQYYDVVSSLPLGEWPSCPSDNDITEEEGGESRNVGNPTTDPACSGMRAGSAGGDATSVSTGNGCSSVGASSPSVREDTCGRVPDDDPSPIATDMDEIPAQEAVLESSAAALLDRPAAESELNAEVHDHGGRPHTGMTFSDPQPAL